MKKIIAIVLVFVTFILLGSSLEQKYPENSRNIYILGETWNVNDMKITFVDCIYEENKTTVTFEFENGLDEERHFSFITFGSEDYKSRDIEFVSLKINEETRVYLEQSEKESAIYYINPLEKGTIVITYNENLECKADYTKEYEYVISGFLADSVSFKDTRPWIEPLE